MDRRDETTWVAVELAKAGEVLASEGTLERHLRRDLDLDDSHPIFIPTVVVCRAGVTMTFHLMEGYAFVASGLQDVDYFALEQTSYVEQVMSTVQGPHKMRTLHVISNAQIEAMRKKLTEMVSAQIPVGSKVTVTDGRFRNLDGVVVGVEDIHAHVRITLRSLDLVTTIPRMFLQEQDD